MTTPRRILVTAALPYANGSIHMGHMLEYIQTDIWARFQRAMGNEVVFAWADDAHGTPIMLRAEKEDTSPDELIERMHAEHLKDFEDFALSFDNFSSTHTDTNRELVERIWSALKDRDVVRTDTIEQYFDTERNMFLPDRFIKGSCPRCGAADQYGDSCESCGATYEPTELTDPRSVVSGSTPVMKKTEHYFVTLSAFSDSLREWIRSGALQEEVANKLEEWFADGLRDWDVTRDSPYFGFRIPNTDDKFFYVWMDAPVGYLASFMEVCKRQGWDFEDWMRPDSNAEMHHFIGKDIIYFHCLFWPAMLEGAGLKRPTGVYAHGFLTVNGTKMSKSRGTFIMARTWLEHLHPDYLRYYFAAKLGSGLVDIDLNFEDFRYRVNSDLVGKLVNIASRSAGFIHKFGGGKLAAELPDPELHQRFVGEHLAITEDFEKRNFHAAIRRIMALADEANVYINEHEPWKLAKQEGREDEVVAICTQALNLFRLLMTWLSPVIPQTAGKAAEFLGTRLDDFNLIGDPLLDHEINKFRPLLQRVEEKQTDALLEASRESLSKSGQLTDSPEQANEPDSEDDDMIQFDEFMKVDLRIARIEKAEEIEGADKLLRLQLDLGELGQRQVLAGIRGYYEPGELDGRLTVVVANLEPRKMRFGTSEGMVLAASGEDDRPFLLSPDSGAEPGMRIK
ncbi:MULTISPECIES: methionine--tRNA ligase [unclassified Wenzhouxiangella]|uniref:methionine--tRNA ligase n=1 Tax=unclassified Wenzhouxiangella TaxID=2613841 RepID=UPI000E3261EF|nr:MULTISPECIES: methionine--tRNA ligase [unclassified Wenzhouxiangella]RFF29019.1 methionine--tRNA ligase [Wenzhouxiangella sp. 15181]RFP68369.1 methionine--tRNA ligase [Wenzhouxiangella sp. 15190]